MKFESDYEIKNGDEVWVLLSVNANLTGNADLEGIYKSEAALVYDFSNNILGDEVPEKNISMVVSILLGRGANGEHCVVGNREYFMWHTNIRELVLPHKLIEE